MFELPNIYTRLIADITPMQRSFDQMRGEARSFASGIDQAMKEVEASSQAVGVETAKNAKLFGELGNQAKDLKSLLGAGAALGLAAGVAAGVDALSQKLESVALSAGKAQDSSADLISTLLKGIPIVGQLGAAGERLINLATGETQYVAAIKEATRAQEEHIKAVGKLAEVFDKFKSNAVSFRTSVQREIAQLTAGDFQKGLFDIGDTVTGRIGEIRANRESLLDSPELKKIKQEIADAEKALRASQDRLANEPSTIATGSGEMGTTLSPNPLLPNLQRDVAAAEQAVADAKQKLEAKMSEVDETVGGQFADVASLAWKRLTMQVSEAFSGIDTAVSDLDGAAQAGDKVVSMLDRMRDQVAKLNMTNSEKALFDFTKLNGVTAGQVDEYRRLLEELDRAQGMAEETMSSIADEADTASPSKQASKLEKSARQRFQENPEFLRAGSADLSRLQFSLASGSSEDYGMRQVEKLDRIENHLSSLRDKLNFQIVGA